MRDLGGFHADWRIRRIWGKMGNIESVDGQSEMKHHIMPLKVPMPDPTELEEKFAIVLVSCSYLSLSQRNLTTSQTGAIFNLNFSCSDSNSASR